MIVTAAG